jgi:hypothetical protein
MALNFDGANDYIVVGNATTYDNYIDKLNAGGLTLLLNMYNNKTTSQNDIFYSANTTTTNFNNGQQIAISDTLNMNFLGSGTLENIIHVTQSPTLTDWFNLGYESVFATTKYNGRIFENYATLSLTKSDTNQLVSKSANSTRRLWIGWRQDSPANRSFKGKMNNFMIIEKTTTFADRYFLNQFRNRLKVC